MQRYIWEKLFVTTNTEYQLGSLGKSHQNGDYLKEAMRKIVFPQESNLQPLDYRSTALPLELEKTPPRMLN